MKIDVVFSGAPFGAKLKTRLISLMMGGRQNLPEIIPFLSYKPAFFGAAFLAHVQHVLRGPSFWTVAEREMLAAVVSQANGCRFCLESHQAAAEAAVAGTALEGAVQRVLANPADAPVRAELRAVVPFVQKLTRAPQEVDARDVAALRGVVPPAAVEEAIHIVAVFCTINRIADALGFAIPPPASIKKSGKRLFTHGYAA